MKVPGIKALIYLVICVVLGYFIASGVNDFLGSGSNPKLLFEIPVHDAELPTDFSSLEEINAISIPQGALQDDLYQRAVPVLAEAIKTRSGTLPMIVPDSEEPPPGRVIAIGTSLRNRFVKSEAPLFSSQEAFAFLDFQQGKYQVLNIAGASRSGDVYGVYRLAELLHSGARTDIFSLKQTYSPAMPHRFVDLGAVGIPYDPAAWDPGDYSHHNRAFQDVLLAEEPYIDEAAFEQVVAQFKEYVHRMIAYGNNGLIFDGFLEFVNFDRLGDGFKIYDADNQYRKRHLALREKFGQLFKYAHDMGMTVVLRTDMVALTQPLENYFKQQLDGINVSDPEFWQVYRLGLEELFEVFPFVDGLMIRIGEAGDIYDPKGGNYYSGLYVKTDEAVRTMLRSFLEVAETMNKTILFRTWTVGVGQVGDLHTNPETYNRVLGELDSPNLIISTKFAMGDYYSYLPLNPTLASGNQKRIIEFQARREFEGFNAFPNYLGPLHQAALRELRANNPNIIGTWLWPQRGGPLSAGPLSLYLFHGFWHLIDANVFTTSRLAWEPGADMNKLTATWVQQHFSSHAQTVRDLTRMLFLSYETMLKGLYIGSFAKQQILGFGLEPPPMLWIFEWDIVCGSSMVLAIVYSGAEENLEAAVAEGFEAVKLVQHMRTLVQGLNQEYFYDPVLYQKLLASLHYQENLFHTLAWYRKAFLNHYRWLDTGDSNAFTEWNEAFTRFEAKKQEHLEKYKGNLDFPSYDFFAAEIGMSHARHSSIMAWLARLFLVLMVFMLLAGTAFVQSRTPAYPGKTGVRGLCCALFTPWNIARIREASRTDVLVSVLVPLLLVIFAFLVFSSFLSLAFLGWMLLSLLGFALPLVLVTPRETGMRLALPASIMSPILLINALFLSIVAVRGPLYFWLQTWTNRDFRILFIILDVVVCLWLFFVLYAAARSNGRIPVLTTIGNILIALGAMVLVNGLLCIVVGLETALTALNNQLAILPLGLSKILGITTHLNIPSSLPLYAAGLGALLAGIGGLLRLVSCKIQKKSQLN